jgi:hypothetical protein
VAEPARDQDPPAGTEPDVRYLPVPVARAPAGVTPPRPLERVQTAASPATVAAAGGFMAGIATFVLARVLSRRHGRRTFTRSLAGRRRRGAVEVAASRSFLVDVHMLRR